MQRCRDLRCCVPKGGKRAKQWRRVLRRCIPESYAPNILCLLRSGVEFYTVAYQKVWNKVFLFFKTRIWPSHSNEHVNPLVNVVAPFGILEKLTNTLKTNKSKKSKTKIYRKAIEKTEDNASAKEKGISQYLGCLLRSAMLNVVSSTFLQRTTFRAEKRTELFGDLPHPYCPAPGLLKMVSYLPVCNSPPKYGFNLWALTLNCPLFECIISTPP